MTCGCMFIGMSAGYALKTGYLKNLVGDCRSPG